MSVESKTGTAPGDMKPGVVFACYFDMDKHPAVQSYPEAVLILKSSETDAKVYYHLVSTQTEEPTDGLKDLLLAMADPTMPLDGSTDS